MSPLRRFEHTQKKKNRKERKTEPQEMYANVKSTFIHFNNFVIITFH